MWLFAAQLGVVMTRNSVSRHTILSKKKSNAVEFSLSDRCCVSEKFCGIRLTNFLAFCYSISGKKV